MPARFVIWPNAQNPAQLLLGSFFLTAQKCMAGTGPKKKQDHKDLAKKLFI
jgi:hypothetical protein